MPIKIEHTKVGTVAALGLLAGQAKATQREIDYIRAAQERAQAIEHEKQMTAFRAQLDLQASMRSQQWEVEKMEVRSRLDFERSEKERMRKLDDIDNALRQIDREVEAGRITEPQANALRFSQEMKKYGTAPPLSLIQPPKEERPREISPAQRMAAYKQLQTEELREPTWLEKLIPGGKGELTEEEKFYRGMFEKTAKGIPASISTGTISSGLPQPKTQQDYNAIPSGSQYIDSAGNIRTKS